MVIKLGKYTFEGPFDAARFLAEAPGVFVVLCKDFRDQAKFYILDVDESDKLRTAAMNHPNQVDWVKKSHDIGKLAVAANYTGLMTKEDRQKIVQYVRELYNTK
jgi:hypothetical protein